MWGQTRGGSRGTCETWLHEPTGFRVSRAASPRSARTERPLVCLIALGIDAHPRYPLILAANRDEFYSRPSATAAPWDDVPHLVAGRDLREGGTWLGATRGGRWAAVTNVRDAAPPPPSALSRGHLVAHYLSEAFSPDEYVRDLGGRAHLYSGFNLLVGDVSSVVWCANRAAGENPEGPGTDDEVAWSVRSLAPGIYGMSNHLLDTPWPKVVRIKAELTRITASAGELTSDQLLDILLDRTFAAEHELPDTGLDPGLERAVSAAFIATPEYGTRSSTAILRSGNGSMSFVERSYSDDGRQAQDVRYEWVVEDSR
jgi:uncharacterized protein with NRDE domain